MDFVVAGCFSLGLSPLSYIASFVFAQEQRQQRDASATAFFADLKCGIRACLDEHVHTLAGAADVNTKKSIAVSEESACGLTVALHGQLYTLSLSAETLSISGMKLPEIEKADSPRVLFEERITLLRDFMKGFDQMFDAFLKQRAGDSWQNHVEQTRKWIAGKSRVAGVSAMVSPSVSRVVSREVVESS